MIKEIRKYVYRNVLNKNISVFFLCTFFPIFPNFWFVCMPHATFTIDWDEGQKGFKIGWRWNFKRYLIGWQFVSLNFIPIRSPILFISSINQLILYLHIVHKFHQFLFFAIQLCKIVITINKMQKKWFHLLFLSSSTNDSTLEAQSLTLKYKPLWHSLIAEYWDRNKKWETEWKRWRDEKKKWLGKSSSFVCSVNAWITCHLILICAHTHLQFTYSILMCIPSSGNELHHYE